MRSIKDILKSKVFANYSHMTISQVANIVVSMVIYPIVIRALGAEEYGVYVFGSALLSYFNVLIDFGLSTPLVKRYVDCADDNVRQNRLFSTVCALKGAMYLLSLLLMCGAVQIVPLLKCNALVYIIIMLQGLWDILSFQWIYQAKQRMYVVTYCSVISRVLMIPFVIIFVNDDSDLLLFVVFNALFWVLGALAVLAHLLFVEKFRFVRITFGDVKSLLRDGMPFLSSDIIGALRNEVAVVFVGSFLGMRDVAIYDLANKVVSIPRTLIMNINRALYPDVLSTGKYDVRKILRYEYLLGLLVVVGVALFGYWAVLLLGGVSMIEAYGVSIILSLSIITWFVVGAYINFIFVPAGVYRYVTIKQAVAVAGFVIFCAPLMYFYGNVYAFAISFVVSEFVELAYCHIVSRRKGLL